MFSMDCKKSCPPPIPPAIYHQATPSAYVRGVDTKYPPTLDATPNTCINRYYIYTDFRRDRGGKTRLDTCTDFKKDSCGHSIGLVGRHPTGRWLEYLGRVVRPEHHSYAGGARLPRDACKCVLRIYICIECEKRRNNMPKSRNKRGEVSSHRHPSSKKKSRCPSPVLLR